MSTITREFTKERLIEHLRTRIEHRKGLIASMHIDRGYRDYLKLELLSSEIALASLEAEAVPDERYQHLSELYHAQEKRLFKLAQRIKGQSFDKYAHSPSQAIDVLEAAIFGEDSDHSNAAMLQGVEPVTTAYTVIPDCSCHTCRPVTFADSRFVVCPECGNKRCPHANDHRNACTGSNEPGQEGSAYPAAPQQEVK